MGACHNKGSATYITKGRNTTGGNDKLQVENYGGFQFEYEGTTFTYLQKDGKVYDVSDLGQLPQEMNVDVSATELAERAKKNGRNVTVLSPAQMRQREADRDAERKQRENIDYELGVGVPWGNKAYRKRARQDRLTTRMQRRRR